MKHHTIAGGGGTRLHLVEAGNSRGPAILFIHGLSQCWLQWSRQLDSTLAQTHRLVAMDMRGHGQSDRPRDGYGDSRRWADDVDAAIRQLELDRPILCGWSYGPLVILDYVRHHGEERIGGMHFVGAVTKLGSEAAVSVLTAEFLSLVPHLFSQDAEESVRGQEGLLQLCFAREPTAAERYCMLGYSASVPPFVRQALLSRVVDNDDLLPTIRRPVLITHGACDAIVRTEAVEQHAPGSGTRRWTSCRPRDMRRSGTTRRRSTHVWAPSATRSRAQGWCTSDERSAKQPVARVAVEYAGGRSRRHSERKGQSSVQNAERMQALQETGNPDR